CLFHCRPPQSSLFPYTTLFRSSPRAPCKRDGETGGQAPRQGEPGDLIGPPVSWTLRAANDLRNAAMTEPARRRIIWINVLTVMRSEEHTSELQSHLNLVCRLLL